MKNCPTCGTQYTDTTLRYCLQDGATLVDPLETDTPTVAFPETPTIAARRDDSQVTSWRNEEATQIASARPRERKSGVAISLIAAAAVILLIFGAGAIGLWIYLTSGRVSPGNIAANTSNINGSVPTNQGSYFPTPVATASPTRQPTSTVTPPAFPTPPAADSDQARREVSQSIYSWKSMAESRDLRAYMDNYADTVDYYRRAGASREFVRTDKARAFRMYDSMRVEITNISVTVDESGTTATAVFDKEWDFRGERTSSGKVQQQLRLRNQNGRWLITGERDLRVYYTR